MTLRFGLSVGLIWIASLALAPAAHAGGFEFPSSGTHALGRGGAFYARADDPMALYFNPANLAQLDGVQVSLQTHMIHYRSCFDRDGTYSGQLRTAGSDENSRFGPSTQGAPTGWGGLEFPEVCNRTPLGFSPNLVLSWRVNEKFGLGVGLIAPAGVGRVRFGSPSTGTVNTDELTAGEIAAPSRYAVVENNLLIVHPSVGFAYRPHQRFRVGATFGWGIASVDFRNYTREAGNEDISNDIRTRVRAKDLFVPGVIVSAQAEPIDGLELMVGFRWNDDINASGDIELTSGDYRAFPLERRVRDCAGANEDATTRQNMVVDAMNNHVGTSCIGPVDGVRLRASMPWHLRFGVRYASRIDSGDDDASEEGEEPGGYDPLSDEKWDIEFNFTYERNSRVDSFRSSLPANSTLITETGVLTLPTLIEAQVQWNDQMSMSLGGDYNWIPGVLSTSAGFSFETNGVDDAFVNVSFAPHLQFGLHLGATYRVGPVDLSIAYAHFFVQSRTVSTSEADIPQIVASSVVPPTSVNAGSYDVSFDVLSLGATARF